MSLDTVLIKAASRCNINCRYCYVYQMGDSGWREMPPQLSQKSASEIARCLREFILETERPLAVVFHGGEPLLLGPRKLEKILAEFRRQLPATCSFGIQTNGMLLSERILDVCADFETTISVSLDGPKREHDEDRFTFNGKGTFDIVMAGINLLKAHKRSDFLFSGLLAVINPRTDPLRVYNFFKSLGPPGVDFLYRDGNHSRLPWGKSSFDTTEYGRWLVTLFDRYLTDPRPLRIRFLDDLIKLILGGRGSKDGAGLTDYGFLVFETDGSIAKNDTLKSAFNGADRFSEKLFARDMKISTLLATKEYQRYHKEQRPSSKTCLDCRELVVCGGGMTLHRWRDGEGFNNPSIYCNDQRRLISHMRSSLSAIQSEMKASAKNA